MTREYFAVRSHIVGNVERWENCYDPDSLRYMTAAAAASRGLRLWGHDDFNIAVVEQGDVLVDWMWMDESIGEPPDVLAEIAAALGLRTAP